MTYHNRLNENTKQGEFGEYIVKTMFESIGYNVVMPNDKYSFYDIEINDIFDQKMLIQVKTITRYQIGNCFSIKNGPKNETISNMLKCDALIIVSRDPHITVAPKDTEWGGLILLVKNHKNRKIDSLGQYNVRATEKNLKIIRRLTDNERTIVNSFNTHFEPKLN